MHRDSGPQKNLSTYLPFLIPNCSSGDSGIPSPAGHWRFPGASVFGLDTLSVPQRHVQTCLKLHNGLQPVYWKGWLFLHLPYPSCQQERSAQAGWAHRPGGKTDPGSKHPLQIHLHPEAFNTRMCWELPRCLGRLLGFLHSRPNKR